MRVISNPPVTKNAKLLSFVPELKKVERIHKLFLMKPEAAYFIPILVIRFLSVKYLRIYFFFRDGQSSFAFFGVLSVDTL